MDMDMDDDEDDDDLKPASLNMDDIFDNDQDDDEQENVDQSTIAEEPSVMLPSLPPLPAALTQSISALAQSVSLAADNVAQSIAVEISTDDPCGCHGCS
jgi:hypothetical protein